MPLEIRRTDARNEAFRSLVQQLDADLDDRYGDQQDFYGQFNALDAIKQVVVAYLEGEAIACGAIKAFDQQSMEVKRMYVQHAARGNGVATQVLKELETWAQSLGYTHCVLQLADNQPEALALYEKNGYARTENFGQYIGDENSICMRKELV